MRLRFLESGALATLLGVFCISFACAQNASPALQTNGCGSGWSSFIVPNSIPLLRCEFKASCNRHDVCYGQCEAGGTNFGKPMCEYNRCKAGGDLYRKEVCDDPKFVSLFAAANGRKKTCDQSLCDDIRAANKGISACEAFAIVYREAVNYLGDPHFHGMDADGRTQSGDEYRAALEAFFQHGTEEQFADFVRKEDNQSGAVDFKAPLRYSPSAGLRNVR